MDIFFGLVKAFSFGMLISLTIRWIRLLYASRKLRLNQRGPLDRMIEITSEDILNGVIRKRQKQTKQIMDLSIDYDMKDLNDKPNQIPIISPTGISSIYNSFKNKGLSFYIIPNEDIHIALKKGLLPDLSKFLLNDEIYKILHEKELKESEVKKRQEDKKRILIEEQKRLLEEKRKMREKEIEDSIKI
jgi:hypothetical protein